MLQGVIKEKHTLVFCSSVYAQFVPRVYFSALQPGMAGNSRSMVSGSKPGNRVSGFSTSDFNYTTPNYYKNGSIIVDAPKGVFYDSFTFRYDTSRRIDGTFSPVQKIHDKFTPVHSNISLSIKPVNLPSELRDKALIVKIDDKRKDFISAGGTYERFGYVTTQIREFGNYSVAVDTIPPTVKAIKPQAFGKMSGQKKVKLTIKDELSGIAAYKGMINGKWVLLEYDAKNNLLIYVIDENLLPGKNTFLLEVRDGKKNRTYYSALFYL